MSRSVFSHHLSSNHRNDGMYMIDDECCELAHIKPSASIDIKATALDERRCFFIPLIKGSKNLCDCWELCSWCLAYDWSHESKLSTSSHNQPTTPMGLNTQSEKNAYAEKSKPNGLKKSMRATPTRVEMLVHTNLCRAAMDKSTQSTCLYQPTQCTCFCANPLHAPSFSRP